MAIKSGFFNSVGGDRKYDASRFAQYFASFIGNGVFPNPSNNLQIIANNDMTVTVKAGKSWINGYILINDDDYILNLDVADGVLDRIDRIVARYDVAAREIRLQVKKGAFGSSPTAKPVQRDADAYELGLADVFISHGAIGITQNDITDLRLDGDLCGIVHGTVEQVDVTSLFNQYTDGFALKQEEFQQQFMAWFTSIQDVLDENTAGNLLNMINNLTAADVGAVATEDIADNLTTNSASKVLSAKQGYALKTQLDNTKTYPLAHTKSSTVHTLTGLPIANGVYTGQFIAVADYNEGDTWAGGYTAKPNGEDIALPDKAFVTGDVVTVAIDTVGKKLGFKLGGGVNKTLPPQIRNFAATAGSAKVNLSWQLPTLTDDYAGLLIVRKAGTMPLTPADGVKITVSNTTTSYEDTGLINGTTYYYRAFPFNAKKQYQTEMGGAVVSGKPMDGILLSTLPVGSKVRTQINGVDYNTIIVHKGKPSAIYDDSCDGTMVLLEKIYKSQQWHSSDANDYGNSAIKSYLDGAFYDLLDAKTKAAIKQVKIPYRPGSGTSMTVNIGASGLSCKIFLLSGYEMNWTNSDNQYFPADGATLAYFAGTTSTDAKRIGYLSGTATGWWLRSPSTGGSGAWIVLADGSCTVKSCSSSSGIRPAWYNDKNTRVNPTPNPDGSYNLV